MILGEVEETVTVIEIDEETYEEVRHTSTISPFHHLIISPFHHFTIAPFHHFTIAPGVPVHQAEYPDAVREGRRSHPGLAAHAHHRLGSQALLGSRIPRIS